MVNNLSTASTIALATPVDDRERLAQILDEYLVALERGEPIGPDALFARHPDLSDRLREYLSGLKIFHRAVEDHPAAAQPLSVGQLGAGQQLGDFRLEREVGRGGMGVVYEAVQISLGRRVAIKVLPFASAVDEKQITRFKNEAQAAAQVDHPNIVPVFAIGQEQGIYYFAMQFIGGQSLSHLLSDLNREMERQAPSARDLSGVSSRADTLDRVSVVARLGIQVAEALQAAHEIGVVHRDVKPSNLLLDEKGKVWVTDFGVARCKSGISITETGDALGTVRYMSPEQARGQAELVDHRTDVYSLGVTLYELAALRHPFEDVPIAALAFQLGRSHLRRPRYWNNSIPADFENIILKAMAEGRDERYATARDLAEDLRRFVEGQPILARPPTLAARLGKWAKRHKRAVTAAASVLVLALTGALASLVMIAAERAKKVAALEVAMTNQERAEKNFRQARKMLDHFGPRVAQRLAEVPGTEEVRRELLSGMLPYYREFARESANESDLSADLALTYSKIGYLSDELLAQSDAEQAYQAAQGILEQLVRVVNPSPEHLRSLSLCCNNLGQLLHKRGDLAGALAQLDRALSIQKQLTRAWPSSREYQTDLATTHSNLGLVLSQTDDQQRAADCYRAAIAIQETILQVAPQDVVNVSHLAASYNNLSALFRATQPARAGRLVEKALALQLKLVREQPALRTYQIDLALSYNNLGSLLSRQSQWADAEHCFLDAIDIQRRLAAAAPTVVAFRRDLAVSYNNLGMTQSRARELSEAEASFKQALAIQQDLVDGYPQDINLLSRLAGLYNNLGMVAQQRREFAEASSVFRQAIEVQKRAHAQAPEVSFIRESLSKHYFNYAQVLRSLNRPADAAAVVLERRKLWDGDSARLLRVAEELAATCHKLDRGEMRQQYLDETIATLQAAKEAGLEKMPDLAMHPFDVLSDESRVAVLKSKASATNKGENADKELSAVQ